MPNAIRIACIAAALAAPLCAQQTPTPAAAPWWQLTTDLSSDAMQGRDTGTEAYQRAADYVAAHFKADGLKPAGDNGSFFQRVPMHQVDLDTLHSSVELVDSAGAYTPLALLYDITLSPRAGLPPFTEGDLVFVGYGEHPARPRPSRQNRRLLQQHPRRPHARGSAPPSPPPASGWRSHPASPPLISIDNPAAIEPTHWPAAYARSVAFTGGTARPPPRPPPSASASPSKSAAKLFAGTPADAPKSSPTPKKACPSPPCPSPASPPRLARVHRKRHLLPQHPRHLPRL